MWSNDVLIGNYLKLLSIALAEVDGGEPRCSTPPPAGIVHIDPNRAFNAFHNINYRAQEMAVLYLHTIYKRGALLNFPPTHVIIQSQLAKDTKIKV